LVLELEVWNNYDVMLNGPGCLITYWLITTCNRKVSTCNYFLFV
jgi:hypothetical protein